MEPTDLTVRILTDIRDELRTTNQRIDQTNQRIDQTNQRLDQTNARLEQMRQHSVESEIRLGTAITDMTGTLHEVRDHLAVRALEARVQDCERDIADLKRRLP
jgi:chromosome segregation ATPase